MMNKRAYLSPEVQLKTVTTEDILNTSGEIVEQENELLLNSSSLYGTLF